MGRLKNGPFSGFTGRTGSLVGMRKNSKWLMSAVKATATRPPTTLQLNQQMRFGIITSWLSGVKSYIRIGFQGYDSEMSAYNAAVQYNLIHAITGTAPNFNIDYAMVLLSRGELDGAENIEMVVDAQAQLEFNWEANVGSFIGTADDKASFIVYNPAKQRFVAISGVVTRSALTYTLQLPAAFSGDTVHAWMMFVSVNDKQVSTSQYFGETDII